MVRVAIGENRMKSVTATEAKQTMGLLLESVILEPVLVVKGKNRRPVAIVMSYRDYQKLVSEHQRREESKCL